MELPYVVVLEHENDIKDHMSKVIAMADVGYEGALNFNASGYSVKLICYHNTGKSKMFPPADRCKSPSQCPKEFRVVWNELWARAGVEHLKYDTAGLYLKAFEELGLLMSMTGENPFDYAAPEFKNMFCFTDGHVGVFMFLKYDEKLKCEE